MQTKWVTTMILVLLVLGLGCVSQSPAMESKPISKETAKAAEVAPKAQEPVKETPAPKPAVEKPAATQEKTPASELAGLAGKWPQEYHVQYRITSFIGEEISEVLEQEFFKVDKRRIDLFVDDGEQFLNTRTFYLKDETVTCTSMNGEEEFCVKTEPVEAGNDFTKIEQSLADYDVSVDAPTRIAGDQTNCYKLTQKTDASETIVCYTFDGIPLRMSSVGTQDGVPVSTVVEAELLERRVPDNELEAPNAQSLEELDGTA